MPLLALAAALLLLLPGAAKPQTARPPDAPAKPGSKTGRPSGPANYSQALKQWRRVEDISRWIGRHFVYDRKRALRLSESQRARRGRVVIFSPERFFQRPRGVCVDLARFGLETARRVEPASKPEYLLIVFEPRVMGGEVFRRHWLVLFQRQGRYYYFADSRRPGQVAGPHVSLTSLLKKYAAFRQRKIVSFRLLPDYKKRNRRKRRYRRGKRSLPQKRLGGQHWRASMAKQSKDGIGRRFFLGTLSGIALLLGLPAWLRARFIKGFPVRTVEALDSNFDPRTGRLIRQGGEASPYKLTLDGLVQAPQRLTYQQLKHLPQVSQTSDFHCVEGWSVPDLTWGGFRFSELVKLVRPKDQAKWVIFHSLGQTGQTPGGLNHYREPFPLAELLDPGRRIIVALSLGGKPLPQEHGAPLRVVAPLDLGYKSIKFVERVEFTAQAKPGWWTLANPIYPIKARVPASRLRRR